MTQNTILILQAAAGALQFFNVGAATLKTPLSPLIQLFLGALLLGLQIYLQMAGNKTVPDNIQSIINDAIQKEIGHQDKGKQ